jgi:hypothetical protein
MSALLILRMKRVLDAWLHSKSSCFSATPFVKLLPNLSKLAQDILGWGLGVGDYKRSKLQSEYLYATLHLLSHAFHRRPAP